MTTHDPKNSAKNIKELRRHIGLCSSIEISQIFLNPIVWIALMISCWQTLCRQLLSPTVIRLKILRSKPTSHLVLWMGDHGWTIRDAVRQSRCVTLDHTRQMYNVCRRPQLILSVDSQYRACTWKVQAGTSALLTRKRRYKTSSTFKHVLSGANQFHRPVAVGNGCCITPFAVKETAGRKTFDVNREGTYSYR